MKLAICVITYRRKTGLARLLRSIARMTVPVLAKEIALFVIDNDVRESAREVVEGFVPHFPIALFYGREARRGISLARNHAMRLAQDYDCIAFVDDDEAVSENWLVELLRTQSQGDFDLVTGPIHPVYETDFPHWLKKMNFFEHEGYRLDEKVKAGGSNNMLIKRRSPQIPEEFLPAFNLMGGSDGHFVRDAYQRGARIGWAEQAVVYDFIPEGRLRAGWYLQRRFRFGVSNATSARIFQERFWFVKRVLAGSARMLLGLAQIPLFFCKGKVLFFTGIGNICYGAGNFWALFGRTYLEYARKDRE